MLLFTATMPRQVETEVEEMLRDPQRIDLVGRERSKVTGTPDERRDLGQHLMDMSDEQKTAVAVALVKDGKRRGVMVFCRTRRRAGWVAAALRRHEVKTVLIHGDRSQRQRQEALDAFAAGKADVVVATDVASRGLHVPAARCVINYDVPLLPEEYVHRVGRAGHGGGTAEAFTFRSPGDLDRWTHVEKAMRVKLVPEAAPAHGAYMRMRDGFAPDREDPLPKMGRGARGAHGAKPSRPARPGATARPAARRDGVSGKAVRDDAEGTVRPPARSLASMIKNAPAAVKRKKNRVRQGSKAKAKASLRGSQRKAPIAKGQRPGGGVTRQG
jgi:ATP-dependent RNA helicase RhlE